MKVFTEPFRDTRIWKLPTYGISRLYGVSYGRNLRASKV